MKKKKQLQEQDDLYLNYLEDMEIARIVRQRDAEGGKATPLNDLADLVGIKLDN